MADLIFVFNVLNKEKLTNGSEIEFATAATKINSNNLET